MWVRQIGSVFRQEFLSQSVWKAGQTMWVTLSLIALIIAAICWIIGDALIVGFARPNPETHGEFIERMGDDAYAFQLEASDKRLLAGALIADYSVPLLLLGLYAHGYVVRDSIIGLVGVVVMGIGISLSPLAHAGFYPIGLIGQRAWAEFREGRDMEYSIRHARAFLRFLKFAWIPAVGLTFIGGIIFAIPVALDHTALPWWAIFFLPIVWMIPLSFVPKLPYPGKPLLDGAQFNLALLAWAIAFLVLSQVYAPL